MTELQLTRTRDDRRLYALGDVGTLRLRGWTARSAIAESGGRTWELAPRGFWRREVVATDIAGAVAGVFSPAQLRRGGRVQWGDRELTIRPASVWRERYALADGADELALFDARSWGKRPVRVTLPDVAAIDPGLLLFTTFVVRRLAEDTSNAAAGATTASAVVATGG